MAREVTLACGIGGLKATMHALAIEQCLRNRRIAVNFRVGVSGGSLAAAGMSHHKGFIEGPDFVAKTIGKIPEKKLYDLDAPQQVLDWALQRLPRFIRPPRRKGDLPWLAWFRGNGLQREIKGLLKKLGDHTQPYAVVSTGLKPEVEAGAAPVAAQMPPMRNKKIRWFTELHPEHETNDLDFRTMALRASIAIPFAIRPMWTGECYEVDGGVFSLTGEEVAAFACANLMKPVPKKPLLIVSDMQAIAGGDDDEVDYVPDDAFHQANLLLRAAGQTLQQINYQAALRLLEPLEGAILRMTPPQVDVSCKQFQTSKAYDLFLAYTEAIDQSEIWDDVEEWLKNGEQ